MEALFSSFVAADASTIHDDRPVVSLRSDAEKEFAQLCTRSHRGGVYIKHHRKAGGSSLYTVLSKETCSHTPIFSSELPFFNATHSFSTMPNSTVFITSLRHPIDRILSMYWFEGRWPRTCNWQCELNKTKDDTTKVADLDEWIEAVYHQWPDVKYGLRRHSGCGIWTAVENYYTRQLIGIDRGDNRTFVNKTLTMDDLHRAKQVLASFDLVMIEERYKTDPKMVKMFRTISGARPRPQGLPHARKGVERSRHEFAPSKQELQRLHELNRFDMELYEYAKKLSQETVDKWIQREAETAKQWTGRDVENLKKKQAALLQQCVPPKRILPRSQARVMLGGKGCLAKPFFYFTAQKDRPRCLYHSNIS